MLVLTKYVAHHWAPEASAGDLGRRVKRTLDRAAGAGFAAVERSHSRRVAQFWRRSDVRIDGAPGVQQAVRFNLFQLMQATARGEGLGVAAKGVTGHGYEGHYFWDTEIYVVPFLIHTNPRWAKQVLEFRVSMLDAARKRASEIGHGGAAYPWRTINGEEASAWYAARHGAVPHQRRHRLRHSPLPVGRGRPRLRARPGRRGADRDRAAVDGARLLLRAPRRARSASTA